MGEHRQNFFLATKTGERSYEKAREEIYRSLERLQVDSVDLIQLHNLVDPDEWDEAMGEDGALQAAIEARAEGIVRFIGVTGHGTTVAAMHKKSLEHFDFDSVLLPYNYWMMQNPQYTADFEMLLAMCQERNVAVQTIKSITRGPWGDKAQNRATWYEPFEEQEDIDRVVHWALNRPGVFLNTAGDIDLLPKVLAAASRAETAVQAAADARVAHLEATPLFV
jgi:predicted aldo/keto reductase-like oxidoreductase